MDMTTAELTSAITIGIVQAVGFISFESFIISLILFIGIASGRGEHDPESSESPKLSVGEKFVVSFLLFNAIVCVSSATIMFIL